MSISESFIRLARTKAAFRFGSFFCIVIFAIFFSLLISNRVNKTKEPVIESINPTVGSPEEIFTITGQNFGENKDASYVSIAGARITESRYISWTNQEIKLKLPYNVQDGLVKVTTKSGESQPSFFANKSNIPVSIRSDPKSSLPVISSIEPESPSIGDSLTIHGSNFGTAKGSAKIFFTANRSNVSNEQEKLISADCEEFAFEYWTDTEIRVRIPDGAASGQIYIETMRGKSQNYPVQLSFPAGTKSYTSKRTYVITTAVDIQNEKDTPTKDIVLYMPRPPVTSFQPEVKNNETKPRPIIDDDKVNIIFQSEEMFGKDSKQSFFATNIISVYQITSNVDPKKIPTYSTKTSAAYSHYLAQDAIIQSKNDDIINISKNITGKERNPYTKAQLIYNYMIENYRITDKIRSASSKPFDLIRRKTGDSYDFAVIFTALCRASGIIAVPVSGIVVANKDKTYTHWWTEIYLEKFGWLPIDVAFGSGLKYEEFPYTEDAKNFYFGNIDCQHIAFSRGYKEIKQSIANNRTTQKPRFYAMQSLWEEASGKENNYSSFWNDPVIVGIY